MPGLAGAAGRQMDPYTAAHLDDVELLADWCAEVQPRGNDFDIAAMRTSADFVDPKYIAMVDSEVNLQVELLEIGDKNVPDLGRLPVYSSSGPSVDGLDTWSKSTMSQVSIQREHWKGHRAPIEGWSTSGSISSSSVPARAKESVQQSRSDPCVSPICTGRHSASPSTTEQLEKGTTTFMLRNIPNRVKVEAVQARMSALGFGESYDFLYMPLDLQSKQNKGYAFVNLINEEVAMEFVKRVNGTKFEGRLSSKEVHVCKAAAQGVLPTLRTITHSNWSKKEHMPIVRIEGKLMNMTPLAACEMLRIKEQYG
jgi:hypothetical protein